jgi:GNAT superfamily N-acetyltransferase
MEESILREATVDDLDELVALWAHYVRGHQHNPAYRQLTKDALVHRRRAYAAYIERTDATVFVLACSDGGLDGMITCFVEDNVPYFQPGRYARVQTPFVRPGARRRGNLRRLLRAATRWAREEGMTEMRLYTAADNVVANALSEELGFEAALVIRRRPVGKRRAPWAGLEEWEKDEE